jgi:membrane fusion protein
MNKLPTQQRWLGEIIFIRPVSFTVLTVIAMTVALLVLAFLGWGSYTKRTTVTGQLVPNLGVVKVVAPQSGIVLKKWVEEGQKVEAGQVLFELSSERFSSVGETQAQISRQVNKRLSSLQEEQRQTGRLQTEEKNALRQKIRLIEEQLEQIKQQLADQQQRVALAQQAQQRSQDLIQQGFISKDQLQQKSADVLDQKNIQKNLQREKTMLQSEHDEHLHKLQSLPLKQYQYQADLERQLATGLQALSESEAKRRIQITAPISGVVTALNVEVGQAIEATKPLLSLVDQSAVLQAHLYAPSKAIGFVQAGDPVLVRYQAYPYQKYGQAKGKVKQVARTALPEQEQIFKGQKENNHSSSGSPSISSHQPLYLITVELEKQSIQANGKIYQLHPDMLLDADVLQEKRKLYEWVLEPLYSMRF